MLARGRPIKSHLSGGSLLRVPPDARGTPSSHAAPMSSPTAHGLLVALVSAPGSETPERINWPLWLIPRVARRGSRGNSRITPATRRSE